MAYASLEPFGEYRSELRHGQQMAMTANINRDSKARSKPFTAVEFMNFTELPEQKPEEITPEEQTARLKALFKVE